jgi:hypothetical protein
MVGRWPVVAALAALLASACSPGQISGSVCGATLAGAVPLTTVSCTATVGRDATPDGLGLINILLDAAGFYQGAFSVTTPATPTTTTYASTDPGASGNCLVYPHSGQPIWGAGVGGPPDQGSYSLSLTTLAGAVPYPDGGTGLNYSVVHGSANCTMPPVAGSGATGTVTMNATF